MKKESTAYTEHVLDLLTEILREMITLRPLREVDAGITPSLAQGIEFLLQQGVCSVRDIAQGLSMTYSAASQLTERLVRRGLVTRRDNERDRRLSEIRLTDEGQRLAEQIKLRRVMGMSRILKRMDTRCRRELIENLESFILAAVNDEKSALETCTHCGREHIPECVINEVFRTSDGAPVEQIRTRRRATLVSEGR